jgi:hypothetical protein
MKLLPKLLVAATAAGLGVAANAAIMYFDTTTTSDGATVVGNFDYTGGVVSSVNFTSSAGSVVTGVHGYGTGVVNGTDDVITFTSSSGPGTATLVVGLAGGDTFSDIELGNVPFGTIILGSIPNPSYEVVDLGPGNGQFRTLTGGLIIVPEAESYALFAGLGMLAFGAFRRFQKA